MPAAARTSEMISAARGSEARVVPDDQAFAGVLMLVDVIRHRVPDAANVVEGEVVGNDAAPSVGAEFDLGRHYVFFEGARFRFAPPQSLPCCYFCSDVSYQLRVRARTNIFWLIANCCLYQPLQFLLVQILHHFAYILCVLMGSNQQRVVRLYHHESLHPNCLRVAKGSFHLVATIEASSWANCCCERMPDRVRYSRNTKPCFDSSITQDAETTPLQISTSTTRRRPRYNPGR